MISFLDLQKVNSRFELDFKKQFQSFLDAGHYILGDSVKSFEEHYANYCGTDYCLGVSNGLDALTLIFKAYIKLGILNPKDEVIVPANTFIASILAVINADLKPVFVEPEVNTFNISPELIEKAISSKTKAILAVHLYGQLAQMKKINSIAKKNGLVVVEDAAQAHGAISENGLKAGNLSHAAAFSFYPTKNLGALGDAGAITTNDGKLYEMIRMLRNYGFQKRYISELSGVNNRMDEIQAAFLNVKLSYLDKDNDKRRSLAKRYLSEINNNKVKLPQYDNSQSHVFHLFVVQVDDRANFMKYLEDNKIQALVHYPVPPHKQNALNVYSTLDLPISEKIHEKVVSIPLNPILTFEEVTYIIEKINAY